MVGGDDWLAGAGSHNAVGRVSVCVSVLTDAVTNTVESGAEVFSISCVSIEAAEVLNSILVLKECSQAGDAKWISVDSTLLTPECKAKGKCQHSDEY